MHQLTFYLSAILSFQVVSLHPRSMTKFFVSFWRLSSPAMNQDWKISKAGRHFYALVFFDWLLNISLHLKIENFLRRILMQTFFYYSPFCFHAFLAIRLIFRFLGWCFWEEGPGIELVSFCETFLNLYFHLQNRLLFWRHFFYFSRLFLGTNGVFVAIIVTMIFYIAFDINYL